MFNLAEWLTVHQHYALGLVTNCICATKGFTGARGRNFSHRSLRSLLLKTTASLQSGSKIVQMRVRIQMARKEAKINVCDAMNQTEKEAL